MVRRLICKLLGGHIPEHIIDYVPVLTRGYSGGFSIDRVEEIFCRRCHIYLGREEKDLNQH